MTDARRFRGIIFDLDGTLADTLADITAGIRHAAAPWFTGTIEAADVRTRIADGARRIMIDLTGTTDEATLDEMVERFRAYDREHLLDTSVLFPGWAPVLDELERRGVRMAVLSNKPDPQTRQMVATLAGRWRWHGVAGRKPDVPPKPDPTGALALAAAMELAPAEILLLGDSHVDVRTALAAGMTPVGAGWGYARDGELATAGAACVLGEAAHVLQLIG